MPNGQMLIKCLIIGCFCNAVAYIIITLQEFLRKEFSEENIIFWTKCEEFRQITDDAEVCCTTFSIGLCLC